MLFNRLLYDYYITWWRGSKNQPSNQHLKILLEVFVYVDKNFVCFLTTKTSVCLFYFIFWNS
jgi:hypothetical protein